MIIIQLTQIVLCLLLVLLAICVHKYKAWVCAYYPIPQSFGLFTEFEIVFFFKKKTIFLVDLYFYLYVS